MGTGSWGEYLQIAHSYYLHIWGALKNVFSSVWKIVSGVAEWLAKSEMVKDFVTVISKVFMSVWDIVGWIGNKLGWLWDNVLKPILDKLEEGYRWFKRMIGENVGRTIKLGLEIPDAPKLGEFTKLPDYSANLTRFNSGSSAINNAEKEKAKNKERSHKTGETISNGGQKTINITLGKFFENINFTTMNGAESADKLERVVMECMGRVLYNGAKLTK